MDIIFVTVPVTLVFIALAVWIFFWATRNGQYDDMDGPANRILFDDDQDTTEPQQADSSAENTGSSDTHSSSAHLKRTHSNNATGEDDGG